MPKQCYNSTKLKLCTVVNENKCSKTIVHLACTHTHKNQANAKSGNNYIIFLLANPKEKFTRKLVLHLISHVSCTHTQNKCLQKTVSMYLVLQSKDCLVYEHIVKMAKYSSFIYFTKL